eukprot:TRINITY_DN7372_c0_g1_i1.p1 TRINITY_DN7372_c0_g1~~TRINITY_DN7372_c0_g1_i1.p1  ORF type:complete len:336 (-),score=51.97 TRINITY_DN7372_c0_g1_i1:68-1075(-)
MNYLHDVPFDCWCEIFRYLPYDARLASRQVCRLFRDVIANVTKRHLLVVRNMHFSHSARFAGFAAYKFDSESYRWVESDLFDGAPSFRAPFSYAVNGGELVVAALTRTTPASHLSVYCHEPGHDSSWLTMPSLPRALGGESHWDLVTVGSHVYSIGYPVSYYAGDCTIYQLNVTDTVLCSWRVVAITGLMRGPAVGCAGKLYCFNHTAIFCYDPATQQMLTAPVCGVDSYWNELVSDATVLRGKIYGVVQSSRHAEDRAWMCYDPALQTTSFTPIVDADVKKLLVDKPRLVAHAGALVVLAGEHVLMFSPRTAEWLQLPSVPGDEQHAFCCAVSL